MSYDNPTPLRIGMSGTLEGRRLRVAGRVVLGMQEGGETYYWNEFNLVDGFGRNLTLVYEETDDAAEWKLFKDFAPLRSLTAGEAAQKHVGDTVELDGIRRRVSLVDQSRVYLIEGTAPEGVEEGDVADYFNVDTDRGMLVVSWTGDEVEFFEGHHVAAEQVAKAFGVALSSRQITPRATESFSPGLDSEKWGQLVGLALVLIIGGIAFLPPSGCERRVTPPAPAAKRAAPALRLASGAEGKLGPQTFRLTGEALVEINRLGARHERREYQLFGDTARPTLLVHALTGADHEWHLLTPVATASQISPYDAAAGRRGQNLSLGGISMKISELFQCKRLNADGTAVLSSPELQYGFVARSGDDWLLTRWTEDHLDLYRGRSVPERDVLAAFGKR